MSPGGVAAVEPPLSGAEPGTPDGARGAWPPPQVTQRPAGAADAPRADPPDCPAGPFGIPPPPTLPNPPIVPGPTNWRLADALAHPDPDIDLVALGADLEPATLLAAYRIGLFPMDVPEAGRLGWWAPVERGVLHPADLHISRSLARSSRRFSITVDRAFAQVVAGCAAPGRKGAWITPEFAAAYEKLHRLGWAHSIEVWSPAGLAGGLYGVAIGGLFAGESMFHRETDASKIAVAGLVDVVSSAPGGLIDVQWQTGHLATLGVTTRTREAYAAALPALTAAPGPDWPAWRRQEWRAGRGQPSRPMP